MSTQLDKYESSEAGILRLKAERHRLRGVKRRLIKSSVSPSLELREGLRLH